MENRGIGALGYGFGSGFPAVGRKLLAVEAEPTPAAPAPAPGPQPPAHLCRDMKTGAVVSCQNPYTLVIIVAGMSCMMFLVTVAMLLLCLSVAKQRRRERQSREAGGEQQTQLTLPLPAHLATASAAPVDSPEFDNAVFVQLPGDEKPEFFALPKPFLPHGDEKDVKSPAESTGDGNSGEKQSSEAGNDVAVSANRPQSDDDPCVPSSVGLYRNPLFGSR